ncbi:MAG: ribosome maturation protein RimP [Sphingopyxis sp.]
MADIADIAALVEPEAKALGFDLVRVRWQGGEDLTLQVMAERPDTGQLTITDCTALSHRLSDLFDQMEAEGRDPMDEPYRLEVSSPGIDRPLTRIKDFADWVGHDARVVLSDGVVPPESAGLGDGARKNLSGQIMGVDGDVVAIQDRKAGPMRFAFADLADAKLILTDRLIAATRPLDTTGADELVEITAENSEAED